MVNIGVEAIPGPLLSAIRRSWSAFSSTSERWSPVNPALGQCVVTACVVQTHLGGELIRSRVQGDGHFFNQVNGTLVDLTRCQFEEGVIITEPEPVQRAVVLRDAYAKSLYAAYAGIIAVQLIDGIHSTNRPNSVQ